MVKGARAMDAITRLVLLSEDGPDVAIDRAAIGFLHVTIELTASGDAHLERRAWVSGELDLEAFDRRIDAIAATTGTLRIRGPGGELAAFAREVLTRAQRRAPIRNEKSRGELFGRVLEDHRARHDLDRPLVRAAHDHALDRWQWTLRLDRQAPLVVQLAALLRDVERIEGEEPARDPRLPDRAHDARAEGRTPETFLLDVGADRSLARAVGALVRASETPDGTPEAIAVGDADALSFFSLGSARYLAHHGAERTRERIASTLARTSDRARRELASIRLEPAIARLVREVP